jgi:hypothetical protein
MIDNLTQKQNDYALFLPAISGFYATFIGKQRNEQYVDPKRFPQALATKLTDMEQMNWLNSQKALFPYKWSLYSGGHADLDLSKNNTSEDMLRKREPGSVLVGDSGGFQIAKGLWEGDWKANSGCAQAQNKRAAILTWLDNVADYGMGLDIPTWVVRDDFAKSKCKINDHQEAVDATRFNNEYFMQHRKGVANGGAKFLNVLQGASHGEADEWYETMKEYCDPKKYPDRHFDGWGMGGQNMCDVHLILRRLIALKYDGLLQEGVHDWMHFLGTSKLEWAVLLTVIQRVVRRYVNPAFTISFDCASPFLATANGQVYYENSFPLDGKWSYKMMSSADDKKYSSDTRKFSTAVLQDGIFPTFTDSPITDMCQMKDICIYKPGVRQAHISDEDFDPYDPDHYVVVPDKNKNDKIGRTSWDSFSYALLMSHNVWMHLTAVQEANRKFDNGVYPGMMRRQVTGERFEDIVERIFSATTRQASEDIIQKYENYWTEIIGGRGRSGKKTRHVTDTHYKTLFEVVMPEYKEPELDQSLLDKLEDV